jgi:hypothetical protein
MASLQHIGRLGFRHVGLALLAATTIAACSSLPEMSDFRAPTMDLHTFQLGDWNTYARSQTTRTIVSDDLVDAGGRCTGVAMAAPAIPADPATNPSLASAQPAPAPSRGVGLDMTECEVVTAVGVSPQTVDVGTNERGERNVILTFAGTERAGTYRFVGGRLVSLERGPEPPAPVVQVQKKPTKKQAKKEKPKQLPKQPTT